MYPFPDYSLNAVKVAAYHSLKALGKSRTQKVMPLSILKAKTYKYNLT